MTDDKLLREIEGLIKKRREVDYDDYTIGFDHYGLAAEIVRKVQEHYVRKVEAP